MTLISIAIVVGIPVLVLVLCELARRGIARLCKLPAARRFGFIRLGGAGRTRAKLAVLASGPVTAYLAASALALVLYSGRGVAGSGQWYGVTRVVPGFDATGKLREGDLIVALDHTPVDYRRSVAQLVNERHGAPVTLTIERAGEVHDVVVQPRKQATESKAVTIWRLGIQVEPQRELVSDAATTIPAALAYPAAQLRALGHGLATLVVGSDEADPGGPVRIVDEFRRTVDDWSLLERAMVLAVYTLLGLLGFDGVRAILLAIAAIRRTPAG
jgi:membrane-associated protease RseP (regulator of RpoE activity)